jgi:hypothetical protein
VPFKASDTPPGHKGPREGFSDGVLRLGPPSSVEGALSDLTAASCQILLANPQVFPVPLVHTVTPTGAVRTLVPFLSGYPIEALYAQLWHVNAAIVCGFTPRPAPDGTASPAIGDAPAPEEIVARAIEPKDPHVLKFTEACEREHAIRQDSVYLLAAQSVLQRTPAW